MKIELEQRLMKSFPFMRAHNWSGKSLDFPISCDCGDGWFSLIYELCEKIQKVLNNESKEFKESFYVLQIKEKFASLRVCTSCINDEIDKLIDAVETDSTHICEECGASGEARTKYGWKKTLCEEHKSQMCYI